MRNRAHFKRDFASNAQEALPLDPAGGLLSPRVNGQLCARPMPMPMTLNLAVGCLAASCESKDELILHKRAIFVQIRKRPTSVESVDSSMSRYHDLETTLLKILAMALLC